MTTFLDAAYRHVVHQLMVPGVLVSSTEMMHACGILKCDQHKKTSNRMQGCTLVYPSSKNLLEALILAFLFIFS